VVKLFLFKPDRSQGLVQRVLNTATKDCDSPDVRDRAYIYWRLLSTDPGQQRYQGFCVSFCYHSRSYAIIVCCPCTSTTDIVASHHRCSSTSQRAHRRSIQPRKCLSKTSRDIHRPGKNRRRINAAQRGRVSYLSLFAPAHKTKLSVCSTALPIRQRPHFRRSRRDRSRKICSTSTTSPRQSSRRASLRLKYCNSPRRRISCPERRPTRSTTSFRFLGTRRCRPACHRRSPHCQRAHQL
jgi:hypothetical protein